MEDSYEEGSKELTRPSRRGFHLRPKAGHDVDVGEMRHLARYPEIFYAKWIQNDSC